MLKKDKSTKIIAPDKYTGGSATSDNSGKLKTGSLKVSPSLPGAKSMPSPKESTISDSADDTKISCKQESVTAIKPVVLK